jgi:gamma-D-glutamyl-L-lysine dipeptidyl-peptidase
MNHGICYLSLVPVRKEASDRSEMVTQLLFGEHFEIIGINKQWYKIRIAHDDYEGWIDEKLVMPISAQDFQKLNTNPVVTTSSLVEIITNSDNIFPIVIGSSLPFYNEEYCYINNNKYSYDGPVSIQDKPRKETITENAFMYLNAPYLWGGRSPFGIDCSGLTQMVYKMSGIKLKRDAKQQAEQGHTLSLIDEAEPGDLAFFDNDEGLITHVGIFLSSNKIIHASGKVRIDKIDYHGIYNPEKQKYSHKIRLIKRML